RRSLAPVGDMTRRAARIGAENLSERLPVANASDELGQLAVVLNDLLDRLQSAFQRQRQFMAAAAHELRTPVAVVRGAAELELPESMPFAGDRLLVQRIFSNLIENAVRHTGGAARVEVTGERGERVYEIRVRDHGRGIQPADVDRVFEPFFRGEEAHGVGGS